MRALTRPTRPDLRSTAEKDTRDNAAPSSAADVFLITASNGATLKRDEKPRATLLPSGRLFQASEGCLARVLRLSCKHRQRYARNVRKIHPRKRRSRRRSTRCNNIVNLTFPICPSPLHHRSIKIHATTAVVTRLDRCENRGSDSLGKYTRFLENNTDIRALPLNSRKNNSRRRKGSLNETSSCFDSCSHTHTCGSLPPCLGYFATQLSPSNYYLPANWRRHPSHFARMNVVNSTRSAIFTEFSTRSPRDKVAPDPRRHYGDRM